MISNRGILRDRAKEMNIEKKAFNHMKDWNIRQNMNNKEYFIEYLSKHKGKTTMEMFKVPGPWKHRSYYTGAWHINRAKELGIDVGSLMGWNRTDVETRITREQVIKLAKKSTSLGNLGEKTYTAVSYAKKHKMIKELENYYIKNGVLEVNSNTFYSKIKDAADTHNTSVSAIIQHVKKNKPFTKGSLKGLKFIRQTRNFDNKVVA